MDAQAYIDELKAKKRRRRILAIVISVLVLLFMLPDILAFWGVGGQEPELDTLLTLVPELELTQAEKDLADTILEPEIFRHALTYDATGYVAFTPDEVWELIAPVIPEGAAINEIRVQGAVICIDFQTGDLRTILEYVDPDRSGTVDQIRKAVAPLEPQPEPFTPESQGFYQISFDIRTGETTVLESMAF